MSKDVRNKYVRYNELKEENEKLREEVERLQKEVRKQSNIIGVINDLVYDDGSYNLTWDKFNEIMGMIE